ncbi:MAG: glycosyl transferase [Pedobacter sp.]|nr:MAG: glycosyl transferase [Pedobacter sp.]
MRSNKIIQYVLNQLYRYPKSKLQRLDKFGGYFEFRKMIRNQRLMKLKSLELLPIKSYNDGLPIYFLTGEKYLYQTLFCIQSLSKNSIQKFRYILVDDGSFNEDLVERIKRQLPDAGVVSKEEISKNIEKYLPETDYPKLRSKRREYPHIKKLTDIHTIKEDAWKIVLDSDMLFYGEPTDLITWLMHPEKSLHMIDCVEAYGYSRKLMETLSKTKIKEKINVGIIGLNSKKIDWNALEKWCSILEEKEGSSYYLEQALTAMLIGDAETCELLPESYIVNPETDQIFKGGGILHHYVDLSKKEYFNYAWKKFQNESR